jgi:hypothetical protein
MSDLDKFAEILEKDQDILWYFNVKDGMKTLVGSLNYSTKALTLIFKLLDSNPKL